MCVCMTEKVAAECVYGSGVYGTGVWMMASDGKEYNTFLVNIATECVLWGCER